MVVPSSNSILTIIKKVFQKKIEKLPFHENNSSKFELINNLEDYFNTTIREVTIPRTQMITIDKDEPLINAIKLFSESGFSRLPVQEGIKDNIVGILFAVDIFELFESIGDYKVSQVMRKPFFVSYSQQIHEVLSHFRKNRVQLAIVIDEHGGVDGMVTTEDIIEELVGDIPDELNKNEDPTYKMVENGTVIMDANYPLSQFNDLYSKDFQKEGIETIGGYICHSAGKIPEKGESIQLENLEFVIDESNERRLEKLRISAPKI